MSKLQITNPIFPFNEYVPDGEPHVFGERVYLYGSHDQENGDTYCPLDYVCYSASVDNLKEWKFEGVIYRKSDDPENADGQLRLFAPDVCQGPDGRYYLYYVANGLNKFSVAVCDTPAGKYKFYGYVTGLDGEPLTKNWPFDPAVINDNGEVYLYYGFAPTNLDWDDMPDKKDLLGGSVVKLDSDMVTCLTEPTIVIPSETISAGTGFEGHEYFEGPSIRKHKDRYYLIYSSILSHELCYATSEYPNKDFKYGGTIISNCNVGYNGLEDHNKVIMSGNNHGGIVNVKGDWYVFYHRHTHGGDFSRQACAEPIVMRPDGSIPQVEITTSGLNCGPIGTDEPLMAYSCCGLTNGNLPTLFKPEGGKIFPILTSEKGKYFASKLDHNSVMTFKYVKIMNEISLVDIFCRGEAEGYIKITFRDRDSDRFLSFNSEFVGSKLFAPVSIPLHLPEAIYIIEVKFSGKGLLDILNLEFKS